MATRSGRLAGIDEMEEDGSSAVVTAGMVARGSCCCCCDVAVGSILDMEDVGRPPEVGGGDEGGVGATRFVVVVVPSS